MNHIGPSEKPKIYNILKLVGPDQTILSCCKTKKNAKPDYNWKKIGWFEV